jgi:catechol 2,3-dioxygenase-like lactoylglutathione lyase family enzyme
MKYAHVCYRIHDIDRSLEFYCGALGFKELRRVPIRDEAINVYVSPEGSEGTPLELTFNVGRDEPYDIGTGYGHIAYHVTDLDGTLERLAAFYGVELLTLEESVQDDITAANEARMKAYQDSLDTFASATAVLAASLAEVATSVTDAMSQMINKVREMKDGEGLNAATGEYGDLIAMGVIDPAKVTRLALQNAASIAALVLMTDCVIASARPHASPEAAAGAMGRLPGMPPEAEY